MSRSKDSGRVTAVSLFSGAGGIDIGLHQAGIETVACVEKDKIAAQTLRINSRRHEDSPEEDHITVPQKYPWTVIEENINDLVLDDILKAVDIEREEIDLVVGGPPCQTFSRSNEGSRKGTDAERGRLYVEFARLLHQIQPAAFIFENVRGLKSANDGQDLETIRDELEGDTYTTNYRVLNAADYGVPQTRKRIFIVGVPHSREASFPSPTHTKDGRDGTHEWIDVGEALDRLDIDKTIEDSGGYINAIGSKYGPLLKDIPEGANYQHFSERKYDHEQGEYVERKGSELAKKRFDWRSRHWNYLLKLDQNRPSWTIQAGPGTTVGPFHWRARKLSLLEQIQLMDFPSDYYIAGTPSQIQQQIGNAVPPSLAAAIGHELSTSLGLVPTLTGHSNQTHESTEIGTDGQVQLEIEVDTETSPWAYAESILSAILAGETVFVTAHQQAIPYAIDAIELTRRHTQSKLNTEMDERVVEDEQARGDLVSKLEMRVTMGEATVESDSSPCSIR